MQLYLNTSSPYARVVRVCLYEKELMERTELCWCDPWAADSELLKITPLSRIPTLVTEGGEVLTESLLIAHYLDAVGEGAKLLPADGLAETLISRKKFCFHTRNNIFDFFRNKCFYFENLQKKRSAKLMPFFSKDVRVFKSF